MASASRTGLSTRVLQSRNSCVASSSRTAFAEARRAYTPSAARSAEPKKPSFLSWLRTDLTENIIQKPQSPLALAKAKQQSISSPEGEGNLFDRAEKDILERTREGVLRRLEENGKTGVVLPEGLDARKLKKLEKKAMKPTPTEHGYSTAIFKISHRKLNDLGRQISGKPIDQAILQMIFSEKRASTRIKSMLCIARDHAVEYKGLDREKLIVSEAWVEKGEKLKRIDIKGRGRHGIREHPNSSLRVVLRHGRTYEERIRDEHAYKLDKIRSPGLMREFTPVRNYGPAWAW